MNEETRDKTKTEAATETTPVLPLVMPVLMNRLLWRNYPDCPKSVPVYLLNEEQAQRNHSQTLKLLAERGGLSPAEMLAVMDRRPWKNMEWKDSIAELKKRVEVAKQISRCYPH